MRALLCFLAISGLAACQSTMQTSPYFQPEEGVAYRYGEFCGPEHPAVLTTRTPENTHSILYRLAAIEPRDSIDRACKAHDMCYEIAGADSDYCDTAFRAFKDAWVISAEFETQGRQCANLFSEASFGVRYGKGKRRLSYVDSQASLQSGAARLVGATLAPSHVASVARHGFPPPFWSCNLEDFMQRRADADFLERLFETVAARACADDAACIEGVHQRFLATWNTDRFRKALDGAATPQDLELMRKVSCSLNASARVYHAIFWPEAEPDCRGVPVR